MNGKHNFVIIENNVNSNCFIKVNRNGLRLFMFASIKGIAIQ